VEYIVLGCTVVQVVTPVVLGPAGVGATGVVIDRQTLRATSSPKYKLSIDVDSSKINIKLGFTSEAIPVSNGNLLGLTCGAAMAFSETIVNTNRNEDFIFILIFLYIK
jgi:hypothetical protein